MDKSKLLNIAYQLKELMIISQDNKIKNKISNTEFYKIDKRIAKFFKKYPDLLKLTHNNVPLSITAADCEFDNVVLVALDDKEAINSKDIENNTLIAHIIESRLIKSTKKALSLEYIDYKIYKEKFAFFGQHVREVCQIKLKNDKNIEFYHYNPETKEYYNIFKEHNELLKLKNQLVDGRISLENMKKRAKQIHKQIVQDNKENNILIKEKV